MDLHATSATVLSKALAAKQISSVELTKTYLERIGRLNPSLNTLITVCEELALEQAQAADTRRANGAAGRLTGIPYVNKDIFCTKGILTTCASKMLANFVAPYDAHVVEKLNAAGMVMLGKANMDEFAMGSSNETSHFGAVRNPWDLERVPLRLSPRALLPWRQEPTQVAPFVSRQRFAASADSNRHTAVFPDTAWWRLHRAWIRAARWRGTLKIWP